MEIYFEPSFLMSFVFISEEFSKWFSIAVVLVTILVLAVVFVQNLMALKVSADTDAVAGFAYDEKQNILHSEKNAWQKSFGYCRLYDELALGLSMVIDCEPIYMEYEGKKWLIELWKGQYGVMTGCEIGVYTCVDEDVNIPGVFSGTFYGHTLDEDNLNMKFSLMKDSKILFSMEEKHWWINGFAFCEYSEPRELSMYVSIELKSKTMCELFVQALIKAGYTEHEILTNSNTVSFVFDKPRTVQPKNQKGLIAVVTQEKNLLMCRAARYITRNIFCANDKLHCLYKSTPWLCKNAKLIGAKKYRSKFVEIRNAFEQRG